MSKKSKPTVSLEWANEVAHRLEALEKQIQIPWGFSPGILITEIMPDGSTKKVCDRVSRGDVGKLLGDLLNDLGYDISYVPASSSKYELKKRPGKIVYADKSTTKGKWF